MFTTSTMISITRDNIFTIILYNPKERGLTRAYIMYEGTGGWFSSTLEDKVNHCPWYTYDILRVWTCTGFQDLSCKEEEEEDFWFKIKDPK